MWLASDLLTSFAMHAQLYADCSAILWRCDVAGDSPPRGDGLAWGVCALLSGFGLGHVFRCTANKMLNATISAGIMRPPAAPPASGIHVCQEAVSDKGHQRCVLRIKHTTWLKSAGVLMWQLAGQHLGRCASHLTCPWHAA